MIEQILKFSKGGNSRLMLRDAEGTFRAAYANASEDARAQADALIQSASNYTSANPSVGRSNRLNQAEVYDEATRILKGELSTVAPSISGGWGRKVIGDFYALNKNKGQQSAASAAPATGGFTQYGKFDTNYFGLTDDSWDLNTRVQALAENIMSSLGKAEASIAEGKKIRGWDLDKITNLKNYLGNAIQNYANDPRALQAAILKKANDFGITDKAAWDEYFGETDDLSVAEQNKAKLTGWTFADNHSNALLNQYLANNQYRIGTDKEGTLYILDKNYNIVTGKNDTGIEANYYNAGYGSGYAIGQDGRFYVGDNMFSMDQNSPYYTQIKGYVDRIKLQYGDAWTSSAGVFDMNTTLSNHDILNKHAAKFHGKKILDLSRQFGGKLVIATIDNNDFTTAIDPNTGAIDLRNPGLKLYTVNGENLLEGDYNSLRLYIGDLNLSGEGVASLNITAWNDPQVNLDGLVLPRMNLDVNRRTGFTNFFWFNRDVRGNNNKWETGRASDMDLDRDLDIGKQLDATAKYLIYLWGNKNNGELTRVQHSDMARWFGDDKSSLEGIAIIAKALRENPNLFNEASNAEATRKYKETWQAMLRAYKHKLSLPSAASEVTVQKDGGILYAKEGQLLDIAGNTVNIPDMGESYAASVRRKSNELAADENKVREEAAKYGRTAKQQRAGERWTPQDSMRVAALAADVTGLIAAATGAATAGAGNLVAVGAGATSTILDTIADFSDDSISKGQAWKNLGLNVGFTAAAAVGGNAPRLVKSAIKLVPKVMMYASAAGIVFDKEVHNTVSKLTSGEKLDMHDWRNIMNVLKIGTGFGNAVVANRNIKAGQAEGDAILSKHKKALMTADSTIDPNIKYVGVEGSTEAIPIPKDIYEQVNTKLGSGKQEDFDAALGLLTRATDDADAPGAGLSRKDAEGIIESFTKDKKGIKDRLLFWKNEEAKRLRDASTELIDALTGADITAQARLNAILEIRDKARAGKTGWRLKLEEKAENFNPALNAVLGGTQYKNLAELETEERKKLSAFDPQAGKDMDFSDMSESDLTAQRLGMRQDLINDSDVKTRQLELANADRDLAMLRRQQAREKAKAERLKKRLPTVEALEEQIRAAELRKADLSSGLEALRLELANRAAFDLVQAARRAGQEITPEMLRAEREYLSRLAKGRSVVNLPREIEQLESDIKNRLQAVDRMESLIGSSTEGRAIVRNIKLLVKQLNAIDLKYEKLKTEHPEYFGPRGGLKKGAKEAPEVKAIIEEQQKIKKALTKAKNSPQGRAWLEGTGAQKELKVLESSLNAKYNEFMESDDFLKSLPETAKTQAESIANMERMLGESDRDLTQARLRLERRNAREAAIDLAISDSDNLNQKSISSAEKVRNKARKNLHSELDSKRNTYLSGQGVDFGTTSKEVNLKAGDTEMTAASGARAVSYHRIQDLEQARNVAKITRPGLVELPRSEWSKVLPSNIISKVRGLAYDPSNNEFIILLHGGQIQSKFSHLRK